MPKFPDDELHQHFNWLCAVEHCNCPSKNIIPATAAPDTALTLTAYIALVVVALIALAPVNCINVFAMLRVVLALTMP